MDVFKMYRNISNKTKLFVIYWGRIVFAKDPIKVGLFTKLKANFLGGFLGSQWALYDLNLKKRKDYLSEFDWYRSRYINQPFDNILNNKVTTTEVLGKYIRMPKIFLINVNGLTMDYEGNTVSIEAVINKIRTAKNSFIKPFSRGKGIGVERLSYGEGGFSLNETPIDEKELADMIAKREDWYLSEAIEQHSYADNLYSKTLNTIRIITLRDPESKEFSVFFAVQRIGTKDTIPVDNGSQGGIICNIDLETGRLSEGRRLHDKEVYEKHPDSNVAFGDVTIPDWQDTKEEILMVARKLPYLHFIAWDIIKMPDGTNCVIEANTSSGVNIIQLWGDQRNKKLGNFYRAHKVIR